MSCGATGGCCCLGIQRPFKIPAVPRQADLLLSVTKNCLWNRHISVNDTYIRVVIESLTRRTLDQGQGTAVLPQSSSPSRFWGALSPGVQSSKGSRNWGGATPLVQSTSPSRNWGTGTPLVQSTSPSKNWGTGTPLVQSTSPSKNWGTGSPLVQSSSPSRAWGVGVGTPPVQSSAPSFLRGWLSKQRGRSVVEEQAMQVTYIERTSTHGPVWSHCQVTALTDLTACLYVFSNLVVAVCWESCAFCTCRICMGNGILATSLLWHAYVVY